MVVDEFTKMRMQSYGTYIFYKKKLLARLRGVANKLFKFEELSEKKTDELRIFEPW